MSPDMQAGKGILKGNCALLQGSGWTDLIIAALQLGLDPLTHLLAPDLEVCIAVLAPAMASKKWSS